MQFVRLRLAGFKSFVEPAELLIRAGLTGIVGPNGCGKSNLLEAIRWVMGESSARSLRAAAGGEGMNDVIFAGTARRPARDIAQVTLGVEFETTAPPPFEGARALDISRTIRRGEGSTYAVNGAEVRLKDVQLLFADAATGARSPALVSQGQVARLIAARPAERRLLIEEAAGISGLAARRKEAEARLRAVDANLQRLDDVLRASDAQATALRRQARAAERYRELSALLRAAEMALLRRGWDAGRSALAAADTALAAVAADLAAAGAAADAATRAEAVAAAALPGLRAAEAAAAEELQQLRTARATLVAEQAAAAAQVRALDAAIAAAKGDAGRERARGADAAATSARLAVERAAAAERGATAAARAPADEAAAVAAEAGAAAAEAALGRAIEEHAALVAAGRAARARSDAARARVARLAAEASRHAAERERFAAEPDPAAAIAALDADIATHAAAAATASADIAAAEDARASAALARDAAEAALAAARAELRGLDAELAALGRLAAGNPAVRVPLGVAPGYEAAAAAALGDDIHAATGEGGDAAVPRWRLLVGASDPALPSGVAPLAAKVAAPPELARRLAQVGVVEAPPAAELLAALRPGQRLVSRDGWLWRWDGFVAPPGGRAGAIAERLAHDNRRLALEASAAGARMTAAAAAQGAEAARSALEAAQHAEQAARGRRREAERLEREAGVRRQQAATAAAARDARAAALQLTAGRLAAEGAAARAEEAEAEATLRALPDERLAAAALAAARTAAAAARSTLAAARARAADTRRAMLDAGQQETRLAAEIAAWKQRAAESAAALAALAERGAALAADRGALAAVPDAATDHLRQFDRDIARAETARTAAAAAVVTAETERARLQAEAVAAAGAVADRREARATAAAAAEQVRARLDALRAEALERFGVQPQGLAVDPALPADAAALAALVADRTAERDRLGIVNLRAAIELEELDTAQTARLAEREDLLGAIARLRGAIGSLNREGRARLEAAFATVDGHFRSLFATLFGGGAAELELVENDDPLDAGLEIRAQPPGKKLQSLSLLSGGEQALTAAALIFALFLANPAPVCVLDEVDAPLDDANVARFLHLLDHMVATTRTRFLIVTHNPVTMSRMHRLYGVTMAEPGVSRLVAVDLAEAVALLP